MGGGHPDLAQSGDRRHLRPGSVWVARGEYRGVERREHIDAGRHPCVILKPSATSHPGWWRAEGSPGRRNRTSCSRGRQRPSDPGRTAHGESGQSVPAPAARRQGRCFQILQPAMYVGEAVAQGFRIWW